MAEVQLNYDKIEYIAMCATPGMMQPWHNLEFIVG